MSFFKRQPSVFELTSSRDGKEFFSRVAVCRTCRFGHISIDSHVFRFFAIDFSGMVFLAVFLQTLSKLRR